MNIVLLTGRVQMMSYKTEELPPCNLRHYEVRQDYSDLRQFCLCYQLKKTTFRFHLTLIRLQNKSIDLFFEVLMVFHQPKRRAEHDCYDAMMTLGLWWKCKMIKGRDNVTQKIFAQYSCFEFLKLLNQTTCLCSPFVCPTSYGVSSLLPFISMSSQEFFLTYISLHNQFCSTSINLKNVSNVLNSHDYCLIKNNL